MDSYGYDQDLTTEYEPSLSVDDILAEFLAEPVAPAESEAYGEALPAGEALRTYPPEEAPAPAFDDGTDEEGVRVYRPGSTLAAMEEEALRTAAALAESRFSDQERYAPAYEAPAYEETPEEPFEEAVPRYGKAAGKPGRREKKRNRRQRREPRGRRDLSRTEPYASGWEPEALPVYTEEAPAPEPVMAAPEETEALPATEETYHYSAILEEARQYALAAGEAPAEPEPEPEPASPASPPEEDIDLSPVYHYSAILEEARQFAVAVEEPPVEEEAPVEAEAGAAFTPAFDERFRLDSRRQTMYYNDRELDLSADEDYRPPKQDFMPSYASEEALPEEETEESLSHPGKRRFPSLGKKRRSVRTARPAQEEDEPVAAFTDSDAQPAAYAPDRDYEEDEDTDVRPPEPPALEALSLPSFKDYLIGLVTGLLFRMRGAADKDSTDTMEEDDEDLGPELSPAAASKYYGSHIHALRLRFRICLALLAILCYLSLGLPVPGMLKSVHVAAAMCLAIQFTVMLLCLDVITGAILNIVRRRFGADAMAVLACLVSSIDALCVATDHAGILHMPLCLLSSLSLTGVLLSSLLSARGLRKTIRVPAIGKIAYAVTGEAGSKGHEMTLLKSIRPIKGFVRRTEEAAPDEALFTRISPLLLIAAVLLSLIAALASKRFGDFFYVFSAVLIPAVPVTALLCFALPFYIGSARVFQSGAAIAGWSGLCDIGQSRNLIVTDRDLFPEGSVELDSIRVFADESAEKIIAYAGTMIAASGSSIAPCFSQLMEKHNCRMRQVENFEYLAGGGMKGVIEGDTVLCGSTDLMRLMNVRVPFRLVDKTTVLLAVDGTLYGIFNMKYTPQPQVRKALLRLMRSNRHPVFAIRDFNVTPEMLHESFEVATDGYDFPPYVERFALSEAGDAQDVKVAAVVCREGLGPLTYMADTGRSMYVTTRINLMLTLLSVVIGMAAVFFRLLSGGVSVGFLLVFLLAWTLPVAVLSFFLRS